MKRNRYSVLLTAFLLAACTDDGTEPDVLVLEVTPAALNFVAVNASQQITATLRNNTGAPVSNGSLTFASSDTTRVRVSAAGLVTSVAVGTAEITVRSGAVSSRIPVTITQVAASIEVTPASVSLAIGGTQQLSATVRDAASTQILGANISWTTSDATKVGVSAGGLVTGIATGSATITATSGTATATRVVSVGLSGPPTPVTLTVLGQGIARERYTSEVAVLGSTVYSGSWSNRQAAGNAVKIWNASGANPVVTDSLIIPMAGTTGDVQISDDGRLLVIANEYNPNGAITIFDLTTGGRPAQMSRFTSTEAARGVHTVKLSRVNNRHYAFLSINPAGGSAARLVIVDITDPRTPVQVYQAVMGNPYVHDVFVRDGLLFTALWDDGMTIWDIGGGGAGGTPSGPVQLGNVRTAGGDVHNIHWFHDPRTGEKKYAFIGQESPGAGSLGTPGSTAGDIHVVDVSNLRAPREVAFFHVDGAGVHNFAVDEASGVLYAAYYNAGLRALDVRGDLGNCTAAQRAADGRCNLGLMGRELGRGLTASGNVSVWGVALGGNFLYASDMLNGVWKLDIAPLKR